MLPRGTRRALSPTLFRFGCRVGGQDGGASQDRTCRRKRPVSTRREYLSKRDTTDYLSVVEASIKISPDSSRIIRHQILCCDIIESIDRHRSILAPASITSLADVRIRGFCRYARATLRNNDQLMRKIYRQRGNFLVRKISDEIFLTLLY